MRTSALSTNPVLEADVARLEQAGYDVELLFQPPHVGVLIHGVRLPSGYNKTSARVLLLTTDLYPASAMDMFWVDPDLTLGDGSIPAAAESLEQLFDETWRRYSWHRNTEWRPGRDDLMGHLEFALARLQQAQ